MIETTQVDDSLDGIAIIGISGVFAGARDVYEFWNNLRDGVESISFFTEEEHDLPPWADRGLEWVKAKAILDEPEGFDAGFFGYTPAEAMVMDPQHRIFLERGWEVIEQAGYDSGSYAGPIGVFAGVSTNTYAMASLFANAKSGAGMFTDKDFVATRLSYKLHLRGPSVAVQSACSTSLVAVCIACQSLLNYQCDMAVAGGASIWVPTKGGYPSQPGSPLSPDGHTRAFDLEGGGFVPGSGAGAVLLKRLSEAVEDGDHIWAVVRGFAVNNDGSSKIGYTAPSIDGQAEVVAMAQELAGVDPETITYVEAHGTGTELGDPIEVAALTKAFRAGTSKNGFCALGSVKTNIGHLDSAAGIASLLKTVLALKYKKIPPSLNFKDPNPKIDFATSPFFVNTILRDWERGDTPRRAGVNSFGIGGTNAHVVLEEAPEAAPSPATDDWQLLLLSARSEQAVRAQANLLADFLEANPDANLADAAFTLQSGRKDFGHRAAAVGNDLQGAVADLRSIKPSSAAADMRDGSAEVVFMFPGQGAQYLQMGRELYDRDPEFRRTMDTCFDLLASEFNIDLRSVIYPDPGAAEQEGVEASQRLTQTSMAQPAIFCTEYALAQYWRSRKIEPAACIGHSVGEYVAACLAGVFTFEDGVRLVATRARLMNQVPEGAMLAMRLSEDEAAGWLSDDIVLAAVNGPELCVVSGPIDQVDMLQERVEAAGVPGIRLKTSHAFHSSMMDPILAEFEQYVAGVELKEPQMRYISNLTGTWIEQGQATDPAYWTQHLRRPVRFSKGIEVLLAESRAGQERVLLEVGPGRTLTGLALTHPECHPDRVVASLGHFGGSQPEPARVLRAEGQLWAAGVAVDWDHLHEGSSRRRVPLPTYPFERRRYWATDEPGDLPFLSAVAAADNGPADRFFFPSWKRRPRPVDSAESDLLGAGHPWLILLDAGGLGHKIAGLLDDAGTPFATVEAGAGFSEIDENHFTADPDSKADYGQLLTALQRTNLYPQAVVNLWPMSYDNPAPLEGIGSGRTGFYSMLYLAQAVMESGVTVPVKLAVVTDGGQLVIGDETVVPEKSLVQGPCKVIPQEMAHVDCLQLDLPLGTPAEMTEATAALLVREIAGETTDVKVSFRGGFRWVQSYEQVSLPPPGPDETRLRENGVYLVTGGLGGIGLVLAEWLVETLKAKIVLTSRTPLPARPEWSTWAAGHPDDEQTIRKIEIVERLERAGGHVLVVPADVTDKAAMEQVVEATSQAFGPINGVFHAAGIAGGGIILLKTPEMADRVMAPKVTGTRLLTEVLSGQPLDFMVLCSSMSSLAGGFAQVDYSSANAYMDAVAWKHRAEGGPFTVAINFNAWNEVGMALWTELPGAMKDLRKQYKLPDSISNAEGIDAVRRILGSTDEVQVAISLTNLPEYLKLDRSGKVEHGIDLRGLTPGARQPRPNLQVEFVEPETETEKTISAIWQEIFGFDRVGKMDDFFELGGHSLLALQLLTQLKTRLGVSLTLPTLFEHSVVGTLASIVDATVWAAIEFPGDDQAGDDREEITL